MCVVVSSSFNVGGMVWEGGSCVIFLPFASMLCLLALPVNWGERLLNDAIVIGSTVWGMFTRCLFLWAREYMFCQCEIVFPKHCTVWGMFTRCCYYEPVSSLFAYVKLFPKIKLLLVWMSVPLVYVFFNTGLVLVLRILSLIHTRLLWIGI